MKPQFLKQIAIFMLLVFMAGYIPPAANAQTATKQEPVLLVKIRNIERFLNDVERLMPQTAQQIQAMRVMFQGTAWMDPERSNTVGMFLEDTKTKLILLIPFRTANTRFQATLNAAARKDYYIAAIPPQPNFAVSPAVEETLLKASMTPVLGSITLETSPSRLLPMIEPQMDAALKKMEATQPPPTNPSGLPALDTRVVMSEMLNFSKQMETLRLGMDLSDNILTLQYDIDALPNTLLARILSDPKKDARLMSFPCDLPIQFRSRAPNMSDMMELANLVYGRLYRQLGINLDEMAELTKAFTGEIAGGISIDANGLVLEAIYIMQPGIKGEDFLQKTYLPWIERYGQQISAMIAKQNNKPQRPFYERTPDSIVNGVKVIGFKENINAILPIVDNKPAIFDKLIVEMRIAAAGDLMFIASDDVKMAALMKKGLGLVKTPAQGLTTQVDIKLGAFLKGIQSLLPPKGTAIVWPDSLSNVTMKAEMRDGKLISRTSINIDDIIKLISSVKEQAAKK
jgi:hypothetical protein